MRIAELPWAIAVLAIPGVIDAQADANPATIEPATTPAQPAAFGACLAALRPQAAAAGVSVATFDRYTADLQPHPEVLGFLDRQPEFTTPIWDYLSGLVDEERVADGKRMLAEHADVLARVQARYGVDPATVVAVWGVESDYGRVTGKRPLLESLSTLSCEGRRQTFFRGEFFAALRILQDGDVDIGKLTGSWAGAFGQTQFMPSTFRRLAVDFDGDGRRDLIESTADALASTANYLDKAGWRSGQPWGFEVRLPDGYAPPATGRRDKRPLSAWARDGVLRVDGSALAAPDAPPDMAAGLLLPAGRDGPAFLVARNFDAIYSYNAAESYALAIALLSDRLRGGAGLAAAWPTDDPGLSRAERRELQALLIARGHDIGEVDGMIGSKSRAAIEQEKRRRGILPADGRAGRRILESMRADPAAVQDRIEIPAAKQPGDPPR